MFALGVRDWVWYSKAVFTARVDAGPSHNWLDGWGLDLAWFSSLSSERLCIFGLRGAIYSIFNFILVTSFSSPSPHAANILKILHLLMSWVWWDWPLTWLITIRLVLQWHDAVGWVVWPVNSSPKRTWPITCRVYVKPYDTYPA